METQNLSNIIPVSTVTDKLSELVNLCNLGAYRDPAMQFYQISIPTQLPRKRVFEMKKYFGVDSLKMAIDSVTKEFARRIEEMYMAHIYGAANAIQTSYEIPSDLDDAICRGIAQSTHKGMKCLLVSLGMKDRLYVMPGFNPNHESQTGMIYCIGTYNGVFVFVNANRPIGDTTMVLFNPNGLKMIYRPDSLNVVATYNETEDTDNEIVDIDSSFDFLIKDTDNVEFIKI